MDSDRRRQVGLIDIADLIYVRSEQYLLDCRRQGRDEPDKPMLFGQKEGRIAMANRRKDPLLLFAALHRQLGYPAIREVGTNRSEPGNVARFDAADRTA